MVFRITLLHICLLLASTVHCNSKSVPPHPRLFVQQADLATIKSKLNQQPFNTLWQDIEQHNGALALAFRYLLEENRITGEEAINKGLTLLKEGKDARGLYNPLFIGACVYDWCYPLLSRSQKREFIKEFIRIAKLHEPGYPADPTTTAVVGHNSEGWLLSGQLPAGLAIYDEESQMFDAAESLLRKRYVPVRNFYYQAHMHHQGDSYISTRFQHDIAAAWLFKRAEFEPVFSDNQQYVPYQLLYHLRPDGQQMRSGDTFDDRGRDLRKRRIALFTGSYYRDPYLLSFADLNLFADKKVEDKVFELLFRPADIDKEPLSNLPRVKYFPHPMGEMIVRTGWDMGITSNDAVVQMRIGNYFFGNHQRKDFGTFQIYYKGPLAVSSGVYGGEDKQAQYGKPYWMNYYHQTSSQNGLLVRNPDLKEFEAKRPSVNDGGQYWPNQGQDHPHDLTMLLNPKNGYEMGEVTSYGFAPDSIDPTFSYISGDITAAYPRETVEKVSRTMATITTKNRNIPLIFIVYDQVISQNPSFEKIWLLHCETMPSVEGNAIIIKNNNRHYQSEQRYFGKLVMQSVLPLKKEIQTKRTIQNLFATAVEKRGLVVEKKRKGVESAPWSAAVLPTDDANYHEFLHVGWVTPLSSGESTKVDFSEDTRELAIHLDSDTFLLNAEQGRLKLLN